MTSVVGILNKQAIAIAADSAVTIGNSSKQKIFNKANKVFALSKFHPVGIMIYNSATFMSTPWEVIIKVYRKQLKDTSFPKLNDYINDFISFLKSKDYYTDPETQLEFLGNFIREIIDSFIKGYENEGVNDDIEKAKIEFLNYFDSKIDELSEVVNSGNDTYSEFENYGFDNFLNYSNAIFNDILKFTFEENEIFLPEEIVVKLKRLCYKILITKETIFNYTGLIFTGFGEDEIYPQLIAVNISMTIDNKLRYFIDRNASASISNNLEGAICPFAQTDVIDTILAGIDPSLDEIYINNFKTIFEKYNQAILELIDDNNVLLKNAITNLDINPIIEELNHLNTQIKNKNHINPLMGAVSTLSKEDLAEMAESLIYLTYLKRRFTFAEESVGGPVDVAIISKGDGFIWIKRKHYFKPDFNQNYFNNYLKI